MCLASQRELAFLSFFVNVVSLDAVKRHVVVLLRFWCYVHLHWHTYLMLRVGVGWHWHTCLMLYKLEIGGGFFKTVVICFP